jgi:hypothetical protein
MRTTPCLNSTMVRFNSKVSLNMDVLSQVWLRMRGLNSTMVRFNSKVYFYTLQSENFVSIQLWFDLNHFHFIKIIKKNKVSIPCLPYSTLH